MGKDKETDFLKVYPNPNNIDGTLTIESSSKQEIDKLEIYNSIGVLVYEGQNVGALEHKIELQNIPLRPGIYIVRIHVGSKIKTEVIIMR